jgi:glycosyltransferase involved in cell wall biosynthesis
VYIHGHSTGGTNPSLVEAMYLGLPVIAFDVSFNRATTENKAFYFTTANDLVTIIENTRIAELKEQSLVMKDIADRRYTWEIIAEKYDYLFYRVLRSRKKISVRPAAASQKTQSEFGHHNMQTTSLFYERDKIKM